MLFLNDFCISVINCFRGNLTHGVVILPLDIYYFTASYLDKKINVAPPQSRSYTVSNTLLGSISVSYSQKLFGTHSLLMYRFRYDVPSTMSVSVRTVWVSVLRCTCGLCFCGMGSCVYVKCVCEHLTFTKCANIPRVQIFLLWLLFLPHLSIQGFVYEACYACVCMCVCACMWVRKAAKGNE